jgi:lipopolysaccharide biosynthesis protein
LPVTLPPKVVVFVHFDRHGGVRPQLLSYMREFAAHGRAVVFVTNAGLLKPEAETQLREICSAIIVRRNRGYDFGAWREAIEHLGLPRAETAELILVNDSVFGPLRPIGDMLEKFDYGTADVWGLTESWQTRYHLQSFFLAFGPAALGSAAFTKFWANVRPVPAKSYIVKIYEVGITQVMLKAGLRCAAIWTYDALTSMVDDAALESLLATEQSELGKTDPIHVTRKLQVMKVRDCVARRVAMNPTSDLWRQLLVSGFPFIKRELLRDNPTEVQDIGDWINVARELFGAAPETIVTDLRLMMKDSTP